MDADFGPRFNALGEQIDLILEKLPDPEEMESLKQQSNGRGRKKGITKKPP